ALSTSGWMPALQGFMVEWPLATPTIGLSKSPSRKPTARSMARLGERAGPWVMSLERRLVGAVMASSCRAASLSPSAIAIQYNGRRSLIPIEYEDSGPAPAAALHRGGRTAALRPRRSGAAHLAAAAVALDPRSGSARRRHLACAHPPPRRAHARGRAFSGRSKARGGAARACGTRSRQHGRRRRRKPASGFRFARRLRRAARPAQGLQSGAPWGLPRFARD